MISVVLLRSLSSLGRTFFAWSSAITVAACGLVAFRGSSARIMSAGPAFESAGLTYAGTAGALLAALEAVLVLGAWWLARRSGVLARLSGWLLVAWATLWCVNALRWFRAAPDGMSLGIFAGLCAALLCALPSTRSPGPRLVREPT